MKAKKNTWQRFAGIATFLFALGLCVIFFITMISSIITLLSPGVLVTVNGTTALLITVLLSLACLVNCVMYLYNEDERMQIGVLRVYDDSYKIGCDAVKNARNTLILSCLMMMASAANMKLFIDMCLTKSAFTGYLVVKNCMIIILVLTLVIFLFSLIAYVTAKRKFEATEERVIDFGLLVVEAEYIADKLATKAKENPDDAKSLRKDAEAKVMALPDMQKFPNETGIIQVFVASVFDKTINDKK